MEIKNDLTPILLDVEYATPILAARSHHPLPAILLCTPGLICWALLAGFVTGWMPRFVERLFEGIFLPLLAAAVLTAIVSIIIYLFVPRQRKPWFVILNLVINISGLLFLLGVFIIGAMVSMR
jgi:hypothetical protein